MTIFKWCLTILLLQMFCVYSGESKKECVVLLCNKNYFQKFLDTAADLMDKGKYRGDICLVIGDDLLGDGRLNHDLIQKNHIVVKHFPDLEFDENFREINSRLPNVKKLFQYHKLYLFDTYFKQWETILYIDCGMKIYADIAPIFQARESNRLVAHSDAYPSHVWKLRDQFDRGYVEYYNKLSESFDLEVDYFQTTMMLYDTAIIKENTFSDLYQLALDYPISRSNDQGIIALYFTNVEPLWSQIALRNRKYFLYDYFKRNKKDRYIMVKAT